MWIVEPGAALSASTDDDSDYELQTGGEEEAGIGEEAHDEAEGEDDDDDDDDDDEDVEDSESGNVPQVPQRPRPAAPRYWTTTATNPTTQAFAPPRKIHDVCYLCAGTDHHSAECPEEMCLICLQPGHGYKSCPEGGRICVCNNCGRVGHQRAACPELGKPAPDVSQCRCLSCGELGHIDCSPFEQRPRRVSCFNCGTKGHAAADCGRDGYDRWHRLFASALGSRGGNYGKGGGDGGGKGKGGGDGDGKGERRGAGTTLSNHVGSAPARFSGGKGNGRGGGRGGDGGKVGSRTGFAQRAQASFGAQSQQSPQRSAQHAAGSHEAHHLAREGNRRPQGKKGGKWSDSMPAPQGEGKSKGASWGVEGNFEHEYRRKPSGTHTLSRGIQKKSKGNKGGSGPSMADLIARGRKNQKKGGGR